MLPSLFKKKNACVLDRYMTSMIISQKGTQTTTGIDYLDDGTEEE